MGWLIGIAAVHVVLIGLLFADLGRGAGAPPAVVEGRQALRPSRVALWGGILMVLWSAGALWMVVTEALAGRMTGVLAGLPFALLTGLAAAWVLARYRAHVVLWDTEGVERRSWDGRRRTWRWDDLVSGGEIGLGSDGVPRQLAVRFRDGGVVRAAPNMTGYFAFVAAAKAAAGRGIGPGR